MKLPCVFYLLHNTLNNYKNIFQPFDSDFHWLIMQNRLSKWKKIPCLKVKMRHHVPVGFSRDKSSDFIESKKSKLNRAEKPASSQQALYGFGLKIENFLPDITNNFALKRLTQNTNPERWWKGRVPVCVDAAIGWCWAVAGRECVAAVAARAFVAACSISPHTHTTGGAPPDQSGRPSRAPNNQTM
jgi:hypothetical protein